ncbi:DUF927 domain-containing protein [Thiotrichales bacterium 19S3-7]|nr:DUF927 domain-containing protein [Thiotrichales bacterium 19S3-7]MCF6801116.1 DUF927 domain-containing protein [Thiotrichales bacterium 19S3-11]
MNQIEKIASALNYLSADCSRCEWVEIAMAIKSEIDSEVGFSLFEQWSRSSDKYHQKDTYNAWQSIDANGKVNIATLYYRAKENGWCDEVNKKTEKVSEVITKVNTHLGDKEIQYQKMAIIAEKIYQSAKGASNDYPYLKKKGALTHGVKILNEDVNAFACGFGKKGHLIIPLFNIKGSMLSLLSILPSKKNAQPDKCLMRGAKKSGCFYPIGNYQKDKPIIVSEGFATASSIYQATGLYTIMGVDAGNLKPVVDSLSGLYPENKIIIACDNDQYKSSKNTGIEQAKKAAQSKANVSLIIPEFKSTVSKPTDFNDLHLLEGLSVVREQIIGATTIIPKGYFYAKGRLYYQDESDETPLYLADELKVTADIKDHDNQGYGMRLNWYDKYHQKHAWSMPSKLLAARGFEPIEQELRDGGLNISDSPDAKRYLKRFLNHIQPRQCLTSVYKTGWYNQSYVLADKVYNQPKELPYVFSQSAATTLKSSSIKGDLENWQKEVSRYAIDNPLMILAISFGFVGPLLNRMGMDNFGLHLYGSSSTGKTTLASVLASIWGDQDFIKRWRVTTNGLEAMAVKHNDGLLILDEIAQVNGHEVDQIAYMLGNGSGKARANRKGNSKKIETFRLAYFSTGELSIVEKIKESGKRVPAGAQMRFIDININQKYGVFDNLHGFQSGGDLSNHLKESSRKYYGIAIDAFLTELTNDLDYWKSEVTEFMDDFIAEFKEKYEKPVPNQVQRVLNFFALIAAAGQIATMMQITGWSFSKDKGNAGVCHANAEILKHAMRWADQFGRESLEEQEILTRLYDFMDTNSHRFQLKVQNSSTPANRAGYYKPSENVYMVHNQVWKDEIFKGFNLITVNRYLRSKAILANDFGSERFDGHKVRTCNVVIK